jgi:hypothetical protein
MPAATKAGAASASVRTAIETIRKSLVADMTVSLAMKREGSSRALPLFVARAWRLVHVFFGKNSGRLMVAHRVDLTEPPLLF